MRNTIRLVACVAASAALVASTPSGARAAGVDAGPVWAAPTSLQVTSIRFGDFTGEVFARRVGAGPGSTTVCVGLFKATSQPDGTTRRDGIWGCNFEVPHSAYSFAPLRWKGSLDARVPIERWSTLEQRDGTIITETAPRPSGEARVVLRWTGVGEAKVRRAFGTSLAMIPVWVDVNATKHALVDGTIRLGGDRVSVARVAGTMQQG